MVATTVAEYFRDLGNDVLLAMDSLTRFAMAQREIGLATGEMPATRGYPSSVFGALPRLLERAGPSQRGTISAFYTVLVEGDDLNEPISDAARSFLDGHLVLSRELAASVIYPAIDILESVSRLARDIVAKDHLDDISKIRGWLAAYQKHEDVISIGAYRDGSNPTLDAAIRARATVNEFLAQEHDHVVNAARARTELQSLIDRVESEN
jgi:FliI/YscN family ATPase